MTTPVRGAAGRKVGSAQSKADAQAIVARLKRLGTKATRAGMVRYGIPSDNAFGVPVGLIRDEGKRLGRNHALAQALWKTGWYEARMLCAFVADPERVTPAQMDRWTRDFDSWAICDTLCFHLFDRSAHAYASVTRWATRRAEFEKRAAFALLASLALHDKEQGNAPFVRGLAQVERAASDPRNFVKKGVNWALRSIGTRNHELNAAAVVVARRLANAREATPRWVGKDALRYFASPAVVRRLAARKRADKPSPRS